MRGRARRARVEVLLATVFLSTGGVAIKATALTGWQYACFRSGIAAVVLAVLLRVRPSDWSRAVVLPALAYAASAILFVQSTKLTTAANAILLQSCFPVYVAILAPVLLKERMRLTDFLLAAPALIGVAIIVTGDAPVQVSSPNPKLGNLLALVCGVAWAGVVVGLRALGRAGGDRARRATVAAVVTGNLIAAATALPMALPVTNAAATDWLIIVYAGTFQLGAAYTLFTAAIQYLPAFQVSLLMLAEPAINAVWVWLFIGERPGGQTLVGGVIILTSTLAYLVMSQRHESIGRERHARYRGGSPEVPSSVE